MVPPAITSVCAEGRDGRVAAAGVLSGVVVVIADNYDWISQE
jgi:hypothetical protein